VFGHYTLRARKNPSTHQENFDGQQLDPDAERNAEESRGKELKDALKKS